MFVIGAKTKAVMRDVISDGVDGFLVEFDNSLELAEKLKILIEQEDLREAMGQRGYEKAIKHDWLIIGRLMKEVI